MPTNTIIELLSYPTFCTEEFRPLRERLQTAFCEFLTSNLQLHCYDITESALEVSDIFKGKIVSSHSGLSVQEKEMLKTKNGLIACLTSIDETCRRITIQHEETHKFIFTHRHSHLERVRWEVNRKKMQCRNDIQKIRDMKVIVKSLIHKFRYY